MDTTTLPTTSTASQGSMESMPTRSPHGPIAFLARLFDFSTTPGRISAARNICVALGVAFFVFFLAYHGYLTHAFKTIGRDSAPSIVLAEKIRHHLADADAVFSLAAVSKGDARQAQVRQGMNELDSARDELIAAGANVTYGEDELIPLRRLERALGAYDQAIAAAATRGFDFDMVNAASMIMTEKVLPAATALDKANADHLDKAYSTHGANSIVSGVPSLFLGVALLLALLWAQLDLFRRTSRTLNTGYMVATASSLAFFVACAFCMLAAEGELKVAKRDAFDSIHALWLAKSVASQARAERSMMLLASGRSSDFVHPEDEWNHLSSLISPLDAKGLRLAVSDSRKFGGFLGNSFSNITFYGERAELVAVAMAWAKYIDLPTGAIARARTERVDPGSAAGSALAGDEQAFADFSTHLNRTIEINQAVFDQEVDIAMGRLAVLPWLAMVFLALVCGGVFFGAKPRLDEYRF